MTTCAPDVKQLTIERVQALAIVRFLPGSWSKRFVRNIAARIDRGDTTFTQRQIEAVTRLSWTFRRQLPTALVPEKREAQL